MAADARTREAGRRYWRNVTGALDTNRHSIPSTYGGCRRVGRGRRSPHLRWLPSVGDRRRAPTVSPVVLARGVDRRRLHGWDLRGVCQPEPGNRSTALRRAGYLGVMADVGGEPSDVPSALASIGQRRRRRCVSLLTARGHSSSAGRRPARGRHRAWLSGAARVRSPSNMLPSTARYRASWTSSRASCYRCAGRHRRADRLTCLWAGCLRGAPDPVTSMSAGARLGLRSSSSARQAETQVLVRCANGKTPWFNDVGATG